MAPFQGQRRLVPGTRVKIGEHVVTVQRFLSQGGFAHVYLVQADKAVQLPSGETTATLVLKHMCIWNKDALAAVRAEVAHHRLLHGHTSIVHFVEASAANLQGDGWEIFILMECCAGGGLIDFLNTRLQKRLDEGEVLRIFRDVCRGVHVMHTMDPVLVHRDLKIENILMSQASPPQFKLCDFGSCFEVRDRRPARTPDEKKQLEKELNMHTTIWYRAPEMVDLRLELVIDERADVWALGVLLYKLCFYTTPFEGPNGGPAAILAGRYEMPPHPPYSPAMRSLISTLQSLTQAPCSRSIRNAGRQSSKSSIASSTSCTPRAPRPRRRHAQAPYRARRRPHASNAPTHAKAPSRIRAKLTRHRHASRA